MSHHEAAAAAAAAAAASQALDYKARIASAVPQGSSFTPLMTLYLTDNTSPDDVAAAQAAGIVAYKLYPAGATTNSGEPLQA
jgi:dihydroorotase